MYTWLYCGAVQGFGAIEDLHCVKIVVRIQIIYYYTVHYEIYNTH